MNKRTTTPADETGTKRSASQAFNDFFNRPPIRVTMKIISTITKCFLTVFLIGVITTAVVGCVLTVYVVTNFDPSENLPSLDDISGDKTSVVYILNDQGEEIEHKNIKGAKSVWVSIDSIPKNLQDAVIAIEDKRFETHDGVDWRRTAMAAANSVLRFRDSGFGGSTITQQLIKNLLQDDEVSVSRKVREIFRAIEMEKNYATKTQILECYLNILPLSSNVIGVGAAAQFYFGKEVSDLTLAECALIAGITQNPSKFDPYAHPDNIKRRQEVVLYEMFVQNRITQDEYIQAVNEELLYNIQGNQFNPNTYYDDLLINQVIEYLMTTYKWSERYATHVLYFGGLRIYSNENPALQQQVSNIYTNESNFPQKLSRDLQDPQAAILVTDYEGRVIATVGGRGAKDSDRTLNRSTTSMRQPGSSMKPLAAYSQAIEENIITYSTLLKDEPFLYNGKNYPPNYDNRWTYANYPAEEAVARSLNTTAAGLVMKITPRRSLDFLVNRFHMSTLITPDKSLVVGKNVYNDAVPSMALGGVTNGVTCYDMAAAYQVFGNRGKYNKPYTFYRIERDRGGRVEVMADIYLENEQVLSPDSAYVMNKMLQQVTHASYGTAGGMTAINGSTTFGKTGTTNSEKDVYFAGGTPHYVAASWFGYDLPQPMNKEQTRYARLLWLQTMQVLHQGKPAKNFDDQKGSVVEYAFCRSSGKIAAGGCSVTRPGYYRPNNVPGVCDVAH